jgi:hypothetical protein
MFVVFENHKFPVGAPATRYKGLQVFDDLPEPCPAAMQMVGIIQSVESED